MNVVNKLPYRQCTKCVLDSTDDPNILFNEQGICNYCSTYDIKAQESLYAKDEGTQRLQLIIDKVKAAGKGKPYDCIMGLSGGIDSSYVAYLLKQFGLRPLVVHFDNGWNSELAVKNIENIVQKLNFDLHTYVVNWEEFRDLQRSFFKASVVDIELLTDHAILAIVIRLAKKYNVKYIFSGTNIVTEATLPKHWVHRKNDWLNIKDIHDKFGEVKLRTFPYITFYEGLHNLFFKKIETISILNYLDYVKDEAKKTIIKELEWKDYGGKHYESVFTRFYQAYILPRKFNIDKRKAHLSNLICSEQITREHALSELLKPMIDEDLLKQDKDFVLKKLGFSVDEFEKIMQLPIKSHSSFKTYDTYWERYFKFIHLFIHIKKIFRIK